MQDGPKADWSIPYISVAFFPSLKQNFIAYRSSKVSDWIFKILQLWQSGFSRVYSNCCCSCSFEPEIIKISQSSHKMYSNFSRVYENFKCLYKKMSENLWKAPHTIPRYQGRCYSTWFAPLYPWNDLIMLSVKQRGIKYHFFSFLYDSTWDWSPFSRAIESYFPWMKIADKIDISSFRNWWKKKKN